MLSIKTQDLLRVLRHGTRIKEEVDNAIDKVRVQFPCFINLPTEVLSFFDSAGKSLIFESPLKRRV